MGNIGKSVKIGSVAVGQSYSRNIDISDPKVITTYCSLSLYTINVIEATTNIAIANRSCICIIGSRNTTSGPRWDRSPYECHVKVGICKNLTMLYFNSLLSIRQEGCKPRY